MAMSQKKQKAGHVVMGKLPDPNIEEPKIQYTKLYIEDIICVYGFLFGAKVLGVDEPVLLDYNEIHGGAAVGKKSIIWIQTEFLMGLDQFDNKELEREGTYEYK